MDDTGLPWAVLDDAIHPSRLAPGAYVVVGSVASNAHLLSERPT